MTVSTAADFAGQVILGTVASIHSYWADEPRRIESEILWESVEYLKGEPVASTAAFRLTVQGGKMGSWQMRIAGAPEFATGERWLLFLLPTYKTHPVVGVHQYALRIVDGDGGPRVLSAEGGPVLGVDAEGFIATWSDRTSHGSVADATEEFSGKRLQRIVHLDRAVPLADFLTTLRPILAASRPYDLVASAGAPRISAPTPQPLHPTLRSGQPSPGARPRPVLPPREDVPRPRSGGAKE